MSSCANSDISKLQLEIDRLHGFFIEWFTGCVDDSDDTFALIDESLTENFHLVNPQGLCTLRGPLLTALRSAYKSREGQVYRIECRNVQLLQRIHGMYLVSYEEWQQVQDSETARIVSAWLCDDPSTGNIKWVHVHETWMPGKAPPSDAKMWSPEGMATTSGDA